MLNIDAPDLAQLATILSGEINGENQSFSGITIDSRQLEAGNLFVAVRGPRFDGHDFLEEVKRSGAVAAMVDTFVDVDLPQLKVKDTLVALTTLSKAWRNQVQIPVVGITGSNGKTTVKEMTASILSQQSIGLKTAGNLNNDIGVPLTLLRLTSAHQWAVIEMGANHVGEIDILAGLVQPTVGLVNNISSAHIEGFGSLEDTARTKGAVFAHSAVAVMPEKSVYENIWQEQSNAEQTITFGDVKSADVWFEEIESKQIKIHTKEGNVSLQLALSGTHNYSNAAAATAAAMACQRDLTDVKLGLETMGSIKGRLEEKQHMNGLRVIDDSYNASPLSTKAALDYLMTQSVHTIMALGDMGELGKNAKKAHQEIGMYADDLGLSMLYTVGDMSRYAGDCFQGVSQHFKTKSALLEALRGVVQSDTVVLVKGSRFMQMEKIADALIGDKQLGEME